MEIIVRATVVFFFLFVLLRAVGKRTLAEMSPFDVVIIVVLGDVVQQGVTQEATSLTGAALAAGTMVLWASIASWASFRSKTVLALSEGRPVVVVHDGRVMDEALRVERLPREELLEAARMQGIADLADVRLGVLEANGKFSFVERGEGRGDGAAGAD